MASVLTIDDNPSTRQTTSRVLRHAGFDVCTAATGTEGLWRARARAFDIVLVDLRLPDMRGTDVVRVLKAGGCDAYFVVVTAFPELGAAFEAGACGADAFVDGLLSDDELIDVVRRSLSGQRPVPATMIPAPVSPGQVVPDAPRSHLDPRVRDVIRILEADLTVAAHVPALARRVGLSPSGLRHLFRSATGTSIRSFRMERRLERARQLLVAGHQDVRQIALGVGFGLDGLRDFRRAFRARFGCSPTAYRRRQSRR